MSRFHYSESSERGVPGPLDPGVIPQGQYILAVVDTKVSKDRHVLVTFEVRGGPHDGYRLDEFFAIGAPRRAVRQRASQDFAALCRACGLVPSCKASVLHGIPFEARVRFIEFHQGELRNLVVAYERLSSPNTAVRDASAAVRSRGTSSEDATSEETTVEKRTIVNGVDLTDLLRNLRSRPAAPAGPDDPFDPAEMFEVEEFDKEGDRAPGEGSCDDA